MSCIAAEAFAWRASVIQILATLSNRQEGKIL
jgi:hypothetical protein